MSRCVNINSPEFKKLCLNLNIDASKLKEVVHSYWNSELGKTDEQEGLFPSEDYIKSRLKGRSVEFGKNSLKLWLKKYLNPIIVDSFEYKAALGEAEAAFPNEAVFSYKNADGSYTIDVAKPLLIVEEEAKEREAILKNAKRDAEGNLLAPNGERSLLTEDLYVAVRTKAFKEWFGDWENNPQEASKVVDKNGEPLVVYHGSRATEAFPIFDSSKNHKGKKGFFFTDSHVMASSYGRNIRGFFLNSRDPYIFKGGGQNWNDLYASIKTVAKDKLDEIRIHRNMLKLDLEAGKISQEVYEFWNNKFYKNLDAYTKLKSSQSVIDKIKKIYLLHKLSKFDANSSIIRTTRLAESYLELDSDNTDIIFESIADWGLFLTPKVLKEVSASTSHNVYVVTNPNNIKSVDNRGTYSREDNNVYNNKSVKPSQDITELAKRLFVKHLADVLRLPQNAHVLRKMAHTFMGDIYINKYLTLAKGDLKNNTTIMELSFNELVKTLGFERIFTLIKRPNSTRIAINELAILNHLNESLEIKNLFDNSEEALKVLTLLNFLKGRLGIQYKVISEAEARAITGERSPNRNAFSLDGVAYFVRGKKLSADIAAEEMLHPLVAAIEKNDPKVFKELLQDARKLFPRLHLEIMTAYTERDRTNKENQAVIDTELVTLALSRALVWERTKNPQGNKAKDLIKKFGDWFMNLFRKQKTLDFESIRKPITLEDMAQLINSDAELYYEKAKGLFYNLSTQENTNQENNNQDMANQVGNNINQEFYSGGASGSDTYWREEAAKLGFKTTDYYVQSLDTLSPERREEVEQEYQQIVAKIRKRPFDRNSYSGKLVRRDMLQADSADAVFAIGTVDRGTGYIKGGTAYASTRGIVRGIPVYLFDQDDNTWKVWDKNKAEFVPTAQPKLTPKAAVIGTRNLLDNGKQAITSILQDFKKDIDLQNSSTEIVDAAAQYDQEDDADGISEEYKERIERLAPYLQLNGELEIGIQELFPKITDRIYNKLARHFVKGEDLSSEDYLEISECIKFDNVPVLAEEKEEKEDLQLEEIYRINDQFNAILESGNLTGSDLAEVTDIIADLFSNKIDEMERNRDQVKEILEERGTEEALDYAARIDSLSRFELVYALGFEYFNELVKHDFLSGKRNGVSAENRRKMSEVINNWDYFISRAKNEISKIEGAHIKISAIGERAIAEDDTLVDQYDETGNSIQDQIEDGQLSWQIENNTIDPVTSMTQLVRLRFRGIYAVDKDGNRIMTKWGTEAKVGYNKVSKCLLNWLHDKPTLGKMVETLKKKSKRYPWVEQLLPMLEDTSGKYTTEQSQFFSSLYKPFMKFTNVGTKGGKLVSRQLNEHPFLTMTIKSIEASYKLGTHPLISHGIALGSKALNVRYEKLEELYRTLDSSKESIINELRAVLKNLGAEVDVTKVEITERELKKLLHGLSSKGSDPEVKSSEYQLPEKLRKLVKALDTTRSQIYEELRAVTKGLGFEVDVAEVAPEDDEVKELIDQLQIINEAFSKNINNPGFNPFTYNQKDRSGVRSNFMRFFEKLLDAYEEDAVTSFYEGGKMRQSYLLPSFLTMFTNKFHLEEEAFKKFLLSEFDTEFMKENIEKGEAAWQTGWRNVWLERMANDPKRRKNFKCKTSITFNGSTYMRGMSPQEYTLAMITEFFAESSKQTSSDFLANFRVPIESNKPSAEYITFYARGGAGYKDLLVEDFMRVFSQELSRIQTVILREESRKKTIEDLGKKLKDGEINEKQYSEMVYAVNQRAIANWDTRGKKFVYLDFLNSELPGENFEGTELGKLIDKVIHGKDADKATMAKLAKTAIETAIQARVDSMITDFKRNGVFDRCKEIDGFGQSDDSVTSKLELMLWNDAFAQTQIMQLLITDPAFLKNTDDIQKRFAQVHASGTRANLAATDFEGNPVSDGVHRSITLRDVQGFKANVIENLTIALKRKIAAAKTDAERIAWEAFKEKLVGENGLYRTQLNLADAQAYSCPTSYRKKAFLFGMWTPEHEETYKRIKDGNYTYSDVATVFQPFKPFVYGNGIEETGVDGPMTKMRASVQNKNAECLLVMTDAILASEDTGKPNLLKVLFKVMEESHKNPDGSYRTDGIDTVNFESAVKSGGQGKIDTQAYADGLTLTDGTTLSPEEAFEAQLKSNIYVTTEVNGEAITTYNRGVVKHLSFENYCMQQSVPEHFVDHAQLEGSQQRALIPSDLPSVDENGNTIYYEVGPNKVKMAAKEIRERYDQLHADIIQKGIDEIEELFQLKNQDPQKRKEALSKLLFEQFEKDRRYTGDMLYLVTLDRETGNFPISIEDPSIRTQVEQAICSIIKSRVNKLKVKGGPLVQMSNFGMSKELKIKFKGKNGETLKNRDSFDSDEEFLNYLEENQASMEHWEVIAPAFTKSIFEKFMDSNGIIDIEAIEKLHPDLLKMIGYRIPTEAKYSIAPLKIVGFAPKEMGDVIILPAEVTLITGSDFDVDKEYCIIKTLDIKEKSDSKLRELMIEAITKEGATREQKNAIRKFVDRFINKPFDKDFWLSGGLTEEVYESALQLYRDNRFEVAEAKGVDAMNNEIFDISYSILTHETNVLRALKPGGFEELKDLAYAAIAYRIPEIREIRDTVSPIKEGRNSSDASPSMIRKHRALPPKYTYDTLLKMGSDKVRKLLEQYMKDDKNLIFLDTQIEYYARNNSASSLLGIAAVNSVAHAILVDLNYGIDLTDCPTLDIAGFKIEGTMRIDPPIAADGASIQETLGSNVGASADAAKEPVMNFLNFNPQTFNLYTTMIRLGVPNSIACKLMSSKVLHDAIEVSEARNLAGEWATPESVLREWCSEDSEIAKLGYYEDSSIYSESISEKELVRGIIGDNINVNFKISNALIALYQISKKFRLPDAATRFNSTSSAVGPSVLDNYIFEAKLDEYDEESSLVDMETGESIGLSEIFEKCKMLAKFSEAYRLAGEIVEDQMPQTTAFLKSMDYVRTMPLNISGLHAKFGIPSIVRNDRSIMGKLREFYDSWVAVKQEVISYDEIGFLTTEFPKTIASKKVEHKGNFLVDNIFLDMNERSGFSIIAMNISKIEESSKDMLAAAWLDLYNKDKEFAVDLFKYSFFRGGLGFNPKTFMNVLPTQMKLKVQGYIDLYRNPTTLTSYEADLLYKQFVSNNYLNRKLAPVKNVFSNQRKTKNEVLIYKDDKNSASFAKTKFFKIYDPSTRTYTLYECVGGNEQGPIYRIYKEVPTLGAEGNFIEVSPKNIEQSAFDVQFDLADNGNMNITPEVDDIPADKRQVMAEAKKLLDKLITPELAAAAKEGVQSRLEDAREKYIKSMAARLRELVKKDGYRTASLEKEQEIIDEMLKLLC